MKTSIQGYPRLGKKRELKFALENYWDSKITLSELCDISKQIQSDNWNTQSKLSFQPVGDFSLYDKMLDMAVLLGVIPERFAKADYFEMARGAQALEMTKWFNTNYHYLIPEFDSNFPKHPVDHSVILSQIAWAKQCQVKNPVAVLMGPMTFLALSRGAQQPEIIFERYADLLNAIAKTGIDWVQIDEPILATSQNLDALKGYYAKLTGSPLKIIIQTYFDHVGEHYTWLRDLPVEGIGLDFIYGPENFDLITQHGFPHHKLLFAGLIDGRNVFAASKTEVEQCTRFLLEHIPEQQLVLSTSCSLLHVPLTIKGETHLPPGLAFAEEKIREVLGIQFHTEVATKPNPAVRQRIANHKPVERSPYVKRSEIQQAHLNLPTLPTTSIGSFPQTQEIRALRHKLIQKEITPENYDQQIQQYIQDWVRWQEQIGMDVLVHGEFERNDMVEYFAQQLQGFVFTQQGWVQSYGSRAYRAPIVYSDVSRPKSMTVKESVFAQSLTSKPVKGMLTGPVTMLNWSFVRPDLSREQVCKQIALALRDEVLDLEKHGIKMIQVDEPALREGLPLQQDKQQAYLDWAVEAFHWTVNEVQDKTQIHTHMCYSDFENIIEDIRKLDADVLSIEFARSHTQLLELLRDKHYTNAVGPGVYDVHSPAIPSVDDLKKQISKLLDKLPAKQLWVNPDCGLKTRKTDEARQALAHMVEAAREVRPVAIS